MIGYWLTREGHGGRVFLGTESKDISDYIKGEIDSDEGLSAEECEVLIVTPVEITQKEIDEMPEFEGW